MYPIAILAITVCKKSAAESLIPITKTDTDVYVVAGETYIDSTTHFAATYCKNGKVAYLTNGASEAYASAITLKGNKVYVAGYTTDKNSGSNASE